jgi:hypothetical protein
MEGKEWIDKALDRDWWRAIGSAVMEIRDPKMQ